MASSSRHGKAIDRTSPWSPPQWNEVGQYWISSRIGPSGEYEYDTRYPEPVAQTPESVPRSPGGNTLSRVESRYSSASDGTSGSTYPSTDNQNTYTTASHGSSFGYVGPADYQSTQIHNGYSSSTIAGQGWISPSASAGWLARTNSSARSSSAGYTPGSLDPSPLPRGFSYDRVDEVTQGLGSMILNPIHEQEHSESAGSRLAGVKNIRKAPNSADYEELDSRYRVIPDKDQKKFWKVGRVFMMLWTEPARHLQVPPEGGTRNGSHFSTTYLNGTAYSEIRRFVVVSEGYGNTICSPIHTYSGQATLKHNLPEPQQHAIIYTSRDVPDELAYTLEDGTVLRENLSKDPIRVVKEQKDDEGDLGTLSRINYSKIYTVENYVRVLNIGKVHQNSMESLTQNSFVKQRTEPIQKPRSHEMKEGSSRSGRESKSGRKKK